jgi:MYXO-CTERM domain-containing protein
MKIFKKTLIAATLLLSITSAQAAFVESDWKNAGDALATLDTITGIEWLDLTQTVNMSINDVEGFTGEGNIFGGWRLPTRVEVTQMMINAFPSQASRVSAGGQFAVINATTDNESDRFRALFGNVSTSPTVDYNRGLFKNDPNQSSLLLRSGVFDQRKDDYIVLSSEKDVSGDYNYSAITFGVYLVSDGGTTISSIDDPSMNANNANAPVDNVSSPALLGLMGLGLFGFAARRRNAK